jgi:superfamily II DNA or RNA helicase
VIRHIKGKRGVQRLFRQGYAQPYSSVYLAYGETRRVKLRIGTEAEEELGELARGYFDDEGSLLPEAHGRFWDFLLRAKALDADFRCYDDALAFVLEARERDKRISRLEEGEQRGDILAGLLRTELYPYQREGILFAAKAGRAMIADEMGLGKTVQAIGAATLLRREAGVRRILVVCPTSLKYQWRAEIERFTGEEALVVEGTALVRARLYQVEAPYTIASYHAVGRDLAAIEAMEPDLVILDEAQRIKNWRTKLARSVKRLRSGLAIVLTGTPLENNLEELYSILEFLDPFKLGPYRAFLSAHEIHDESGKVTGYRGLNEIGALLSDLVIRRRKREVLTQLPERIDERRFVPMTKRQSEVHEEYGMMVGRLVLRWRHQGFLNEQDRQRLLVWMSCMRMVCDSTYVLDQDYDKRHDTKVEELLGLLDEALDEPEVKVVVFSQWERMTRLVARELEGRKIGFEHLHGGVPGRKRKEIIERFNSDLFCRVFLSTDAGSTGLNLQAASVLVNLDLPWNPAVLEQRIARIHRIGQGRCVHIVNFVAADTIESRMLSLLGFKADLAEGILDGGEDSIFMADEKYGRFMDNVGKLVQAGGEETAEQEGAKPGPAPGSSFDEDEREELEGTFVEPAKGEKPAEPEKPAELGKPAEPEKPAEREKPEESEELEGTRGADLEASEPSSGLPSGHAPDAPIPLSLATDGAQADGAVTPAAVPSREPTPGDLATRALGVLGDLSRVLSDPESTRRFVSGLMVRDEGSGESYLRIPVTDEKTAADALSLLGGLLSALGERGRAGGGKD